MIPTILRKSPQFQAVRKVLDEAGVPFRIEQGGKHFKCLFEVAGEKLQFFLSATPSDFRAAKKAKCDVARMIRKATPAGVCPA